MVLIFRIFIFYFLSIHCIYSYASLVEANIKNSTGLSLSKITPEDSEVTIESKIIYCKDSENSHGKYFVRLIIYNNKGGIAYQEDSIEYETPNTGGTITHNFVVLTPKFKLDVGTYFVKTIYFENVNGVQTSLAGEVSFEYTYRTLDLSTLVSNVQLISPSYRDTNINQYPIFSWYKPNFLGTVFYNIWISKNENPLVSPIYKKMFIPENKLEYLSTDITLEQNTKYFWVVQAVDSNQNYIGSNNGFSNIEHFLIYNTPITELQLVYPIQKKISDTNEFFEWNKIQEKVFYRISIFKDSTAKDLLWFSETENNKIDVPIHSIANSEKLLIYYWKVEAIKIGKENIYQQSNVSSFFVSKKKKKIESSNLSMDTSGIIGVIHNSLGSTISNAYVYVDTDIHSKQVHTELLNKSIYTKESDTLGNYTLNLPVGSYRFIVYKDLHSLYSKNITIKQNEILREDIILEPLYGNVSGTIKDLDTHELVGDVLVEFRTKTNYQFTYTDKNGFYKIPHLINGTYSIEVSKNPNYKYIFDTNFIVRGSNHSKDYSIEKLKAGHLKGIVSTDISSPLKGASIRIEALKVSALYNFGSVEGTAMSNHTGDFSLPNLRIGIYKVYCKAIGYPEVVQEIEIESGITHTVTFNLQTIRWKIRGKVIDVHKNPLQGVKISVKEYPDFEVAYSNTDGEYLINIPNGEYTLEYFLVNKSIYEHRLLVKDKDGTIPNIFLSEALSQVTFHILTESNVTIQDYTLEIYNSKNTLMPNKVFNNEVYLPGNEIYTFNIVLPNHYNQYTNKKIKYYIRDSLEEIEIILKPKITFEGIIINTKNSPIANVTLTDTSTGVCFNSNKDGFFTYTTETTSNTLEDVIYDFEITHQNYKRKIVSISPKKSTSNLSIILEDIEESNIKDTFKDIAKDDIISFQNNLNILFSKIKNGSKIIESIPSYLYLDSLGSFKAKLNIIATDTITTYKADGIVYIQHPILGNKEVLISNLAFDIKKIIPKLFVDIYGETFNSDIRYDLIFPKELLPFLDKDTGFLFDNIPPELSHKWNEKYFNKILSDKLVKNLLDFTKNTIVDSIRSNFIKLLILEDTKLTDVGFDIHGLEGKFSNIKLTSVSQTLCLLGTVQLKVKNLSNSIIGLDSISSHSTLQLCNNNGKLGILEFNISNNNVSLLSYPSTLDSFLFDFDKKKFSMVGKIKLPLLKADISFTEALFESKGNDWFLSRIYFDISIPIRLEYGGWKFILSNIQYTTKGLTLAGGMDLPAPFNTNLVVDSLFINNEGKVSQANIKGFRSQIFGGEFSTQKIFFDGKDKNIELLLEEISLKIPSVQLDNLSLSKLYLQNIDNKLIIKVENIDVPIHKQFKFAGFDVNLESVAFSCNEKFSIFLKGGVDFKMPFLPVKIGDFTIDQSGKLSVSSFGIGLDLKAVTLKGKISFTNNVFKGSGTLSIVGLLTVDATLEFGNGNWKVFLFMSLGVGINIPATPFFVTGIAGGLEKNKDSFKLSFGCEISVPKVTGILAIVTIDFSNGDLEIDGKAKIISPQEINIGNFKGILSPTKLLLSGTASADFSVAGAGIRGGLSFLVSAKSWGFAVNASIDALNYFKAQGGSSIGYNYNYGEYTFLGKSIQAPKLVNGMMYYFKASANLDFGILTFRFAGDVFIHIGYPTVAGLYGTVYGKIDLFILYASIEVTLDLGGMTDYKSVYFNGSIKGEACVGILKLQTCYSKEVSFSIGDKPSHTVKEEITTSLPTFKDTKINISGILTNQDGIPLSHATIFLKMIGTDFTKSIISREDGSFVFSSIPSSRDGYKIEASKVDSNNHKRFIPILKKIGTLDVDTNIDLSMEEKTLYREMTFTIIDKNTRKVISDAILSITNKTKNTTNQNISSDIKGRVFYSGLLEDNTMVLSVKKYGYETYQEEFPLKGTDIKLNKTITLSVLKNYPVHISVYFKKSEEEYIINSGGSIIDYNTMLRNTVCKNLSVVSKSQNGISHNGSIVCKAIENTKSISTFFDIEFTSLTDLGSYNIEIKGLPTLRNPKDTIIPILISAESTSLRDTITCSQSSTLCKEISVTIDLPKNSATAQNISIKETVPNTIENKLPSILQKYPIPNTLNPILIKDIASVEENRNSYTRGCYGEYFSPENNNYIMWDKLSWVDSSGRESIENGKGYFTYIGCKNTKKQTKTCPNQSYPWEDIETQSIAEYSDYLKRKDGKNKKGAFYKCNTFCTLAASSVAFNYLGFDLQNPPKAIKIGSTSYSFLNGNNISYMLQNDSLKLGSTTYVITQWKQAQAKAQLGELVFVTLDNCDTPQDRNCRAGHIAILIGNSSSKVLKLGQSPASNLYIYQAGSTVGLMTLEQGFGSYIVGDSSRVKFVSVPKKSE